MRSAAAAYRRWRRQTAFKIFEKSFEIRLTNAFWYDMIVKLSREERTAAKPIRQVRQKKFKILQKSFEIRLTNQNGYDMIGRLSRERVHGYAQNKTEWKKFFKKSFEKRLTNGFECDILDELFIRERRTGFGRTQIKNWIKEMN